MLNIKIENCIREIAPLYLAGIIEASVVNMPTSAELSNEINSCIDNLRQLYDIDTVKERSGIKATRQAYRKAGKDPSRYRPSCEQLCRRVLQEKGLYSIDSLVDIGNLISLDSAYSVAVIDKDKITGDTLRLGIGKESEPYEAIGRGHLNIFQMPVWRDDVGGFATPTSDNVRTMCSAETQNVLIIINGYDGDKEAVRQALNKTSALLSKFACGGNVKISITE